MSFNTIDIRQRYKGIGMMKKISLFLCFSITRLFNRIQAPNGMVRSYLSIAWPATVQGLLLQMMFAIDLIMVGDVGVNALAAVAIMGQPEMLMLILARGLSVAITAIVARRYGENNMSEVHAVLKQSILITLIFYIPFLIFCWYFLASILTFTGATSDYLPEAVGYGRWIIASLVFQTLSQTIGASFIGIGHTKIIFYANAIGNLINTVLNVFLIYGYGPVP